jgi:hypothetical protein
MLMKLKKERKRRLSRRQKPCCEFQSLRLFQTA